MFNPTQDNIALNQLHSIVTDRFDENVNLGTRFSGFQRALQKFGFASAILSLIGMSKYHCITKEKYEELYKTNEDSEKRMVLSVGEDLETFIEKIKNGEINKYTILDKTGNTSLTGDVSDTFLLCLLDKDERKKLAQKDKAYMTTYVNHLLGRDVDVPEDEWKASDSKMKFAKFECRRWTYFIDSN